MPFASGKNVSKKILFEASQSVFWSQVATKRKHYTVFLVPNYSEEVMQLTLFSIITSMTVENRAL